MGILSQETPGMRRSRGEEGKIERGRGVYQIKKSRNKRERNEKEKRGGEEREKKGERGISIEEDPRKKTDQK